MGTTRTTREQWMETIAQNIARALMDKDSRKKKKAPIVYRDYFVVGDSWCLSAATGIVHTDKAAVRTITSAARRAPICRVFDLMDPLQRVQARSLESLPQELRDKI